MNVFNYFSNKFHRRKEGQHKIWIPSLKSSETLKRYNTLLDRIFDSTLDFVQVYSSLGLDDPKTPIETTSLSDSYRLLSFMERSLNSITNQIEKVIQEEHVCRHDILEQEKLYDILTNLSLTENQQQLLLEYEQMHQSAYLNEATQIRAKRIIGGNLSSKNILESEHNLQCLRVQKEVDSMELSELQSSNFKKKSQSEQKRHFRRKANEYPELGELYMTKLQSSIDGVKKILNGQGNAEDIVLKRNKPPQTENETNKN